MSKKKRLEKHVHSAPIVKNQIKKTPRWIMPFILILVFIALVPALKAGFVAWDDGVYVYDNPLIKSFSHLALLLTTPVAGGNHHPLTMLSLAINYQISGEEAWSYHLFNIIFHLINCFLVLRFILLLSKGNYIIAFTTTILFGVHPMHVESVAWVSERKDVLYGMFFLAGLISYTKYIDTASRKQYFLTILFLMLSLLSKPAAVIFPVALFCIDFLRRRKWGINLIVEKLPFFILALIMGIITFLAQKEAGATGEIFFSLGNRILFGFYGVMMYILKMFVPINLAPVYPFPAADKTLPAAYFGAPLFFIGLAILVFYSWKRNRVIAFGILFYLANLLLVLQVLQVGMSVISERYTYIPYIGLFYIIGWAIDHYTKGKASTAYLIIISIAVAFGVLTYKQTGVWESSITLWNNAVKAQPSAIAFTGKAMIAHGERNFAQALQYYTRAIELNAAYHEAYIRRGNIYMDQDKLDLAYSDYEKAISLKPNNYVTLASMGGLLGKKGQYDSALYYLDRSIKLNPEYYLAYKNRAITHMQLNQNEAAIQDLKKVLHYQPDDAAIHNAIGNCYHATGKYQEGILAFNRAIELNAAPVYFLNRSYSYTALKNLDAGRKDALAARQGGIQIPIEYAKSLGIQ